MIRLKHLLESTDELIPWVAAHLEDIVIGYDAWLSEHLESMVDAGTITSAQAFDRMQLFGRCSDDAAEFVDYVRHVLRKTPSEIRAFLSRFI